MTALAIALHIDRLEADPVFGWPVAIAASQALAIARLLAEIHRHLRRPAARIKVQLMREYQAIVFARTGIERDGGELAGLGIGHDPRGELRVQSAKIAGVAKLGIDQPLVQSTVTIGAELLPGRLHLRRPLMLGMAVGTGPRPRLAKAMRDGLQQPFAQRRGSPCACQPIGHRVIMGGFVACQATAITHRLKRFNVAGLARIFETMMAGAERAGAPAAVADGADPGIGTAIEVAGDWDRQKQAQDQGREQPRQGPLGGHDTSQGKTALGIKPRALARCRLDPLLGQEHCPVRFARYAQPVAAKSEFGSGGRVNRGGACARTIQSEPQRADCLHRKAPARLKR